MNEALIQFDFVYSWSGDPAGLLLWIACTAILLLAARAFWLSVPAEIEDPMRLKPYRIAIYKSRRLLFWICGGWWVLFFLRILILSSSGTGSDWKTFAQWFSGSVTLSFLFLLGSSFALLLFPQIRRGGARGRLASMLAFGAGIVFQLTFLHINKPFL